MDLLALSNTEAGRFLLGTLGQKIEGRIVAITENCFHELLGFEQDKPIMRATFFSRQPILRLFAPIQEKLKIAMESPYAERVKKNRYKAFLHYAGLEHNKYLPNIYLTSATFNPASGANSPVDGIVDRNGVNETFATIRGSAGNLASVTDASSSLVLIASTTSNQYTEMDRLIWCFNTATLTSAATISSAILSVASTGLKSNSLGSPDFHVASATPASTSTLANSDYSQVGSTSFGSIAYASWTAVNTTFNDVTLNASGIANIAKTGISKFSGQLSWDILNSTTGLTWSSGANSQFRTYFADNGSSIPKLVVTYTLPSGNFFLFM